MGESARRRRQKAAGASPHGSGAQPPGGNDPREQAEAALARLLRLNKPGRTSLAGAYALGFAALAVAQRDGGDAPDWFNELDPLDTLFLGTVWPYQLRSGYEFGNTRTAWLRLMRNSRYWAGIQQFVTEVMAASDTHDLPVDEGELMLLVAGRLEHAGLDQRKLPADLLPGEALAHSRVAVGPDLGFDLPQPPADVTDRITRFWASTEVAMPHDGTPVDALREGLHTFLDHGLELRKSSAVLLPALYAEVAAPDNEPLDGLAERAEAWAWGLAEDSPLIPVVDLLLAAVDRDLDSDTALGHLFALPTFTQPIPAADQQFTSAPGTALVQLAFELGHQQVNTRAGKAIRIGSADKALLEGQLRAFERKFGRPPGPDDPIFFDPDATEPRPMPPANLEYATLTMLNTAGICGAWIYAHQHTDGLLPRPDGSFHSEADRRDWQDALDRYRRSHPDETVDDEAELDKFRSMLAVASLAQAADDPDAGASLVEQLQRPVRDHGTEIEALACFLQDAADYLTARRREPDVVHAATELARAWSGADLATRVHNATTNITNATNADLPVLLALAVASLSQPTD